MIDRDEAESLEQPKRSLCGGQKQQELIGKVKQEPGMLVLANQKVSYFQTLVITSASYPELLKHSLSWGKATI